jgi:branched-chain amino acid transport system substrate-binding protein
MAATMNPKPTKIALLSADDSFSVEVANAAADYAPRVGMQVVFSYQYPSGSTNLYAALDAAPDTPDFARALGKDANYVYSGSQWSPQLKYKSAYSFSAAEFISTYQKMYGTADLPAYQVASATAAGLALQRAIEHADSLAPDKVRDALASLDITTFFGRIKFDQQGQNIFKTVVV